MKDCVDDNSLGLLNDTLIINDILGEGGYSIVYKVTDKNTNNIKNKIIINLIKLIIKKKK